jgi:hypothetical protein
MLRVFQRNWFHILVWTAMFVYLAVAPDLYVHFFLKNGKPLQIDENLPTDSDQIKLKIDGLDQINYEEYEIYRMYGWAFSLMDENVSPDMYDRTIVLTSSTKTYFFPIQTVQRSGVQDAYKHLNMDLVGSGFSVLISKDVIQPGKYRIGIIFKNPSTGLAYYSDKPAKYIIRSPNRLSYIK